MANIKHVDSVVDRAFRNRINQLIDSINAQGKSIQELVAEGQLTPEQYAELIRSVNGLLAVGQVSANDLNPNLGKVGLSLLSDEVIQAMSGNTPVSPIIGDGTVTTQKLAIDAVDFDLLKFAKKSSNLFNKDDVTPGKSIGATTGEPVDNSSFNLSGFIRIKPNSPISMFNVGRWAQYDSDYNFITSNTQQNFTTSPNAFWLRASVSSTSLGTAQINESSTLKSYEPFYVEFDNTEKSGLILEPSKNTVSHDSILPNSVDPGQTLFFKRPMNIFNKNDVIMDRYINSDGSLKTDDRFVTSRNLLRIDPSSRYSVSSTTIMNFYDRNGTYITRLIVVPDTGYFNTPANAYYVKFSINKTLYENAMINKGDLLPYEEHKYKLISTSQFPIEIPSSGDGGSDKIISEYYETYSGTLSSGNTQLVAEINGSLLSKEIYMSTNDLNTELSIEILMDDGTYKPYKLLASDGSGEVPITMENLTVHGSTEFLISSWDIVAKQYAFNLREKQFGKGIKVSVKNNGSTSINATVRVSGGIYA